MTALSTVNNSLSNLSEKEYLQVVERTKNLRKTFKVKIVDVDLQYVMALNKSLGREDKQVVLTSVVDHHYLSHISDPNILFNNMFALPDALTQIFASRNPFVIFDVDEKDTNYIENLRQKIAANLSLVSGDISYNVKVYINIPDMVRYQIVEKEIKRAFPTIEIVSFIPLVSQFDNTKMLEVPTVAEKSLTKTQLFSEMKFIGSKYLLLTDTNSLGKGTEKNNYYKLRKFLGDIILAEDSSEEVYARNLVTDYFFSDYLTVAERLKHMFRCPSLIQLGDFLFLPCWIKKVEVKATVLSLSQMGKQETLTITEDCVVEPVEKGKLLYYLKQSTRFINFSLVKINGKDYFMKSYTVELHTVCLDSFGIQEMQYSLGKELPSAVRFMTNMSDADKEVYARVKDFPDFRETEPHPLTREIVVREAEGKESKKGIWALRNSGLNFSNNLSYITPLVSLEDLLKINCICPVEGFITDVIPCAWR